MVEMQRTFQIPVYLEVMPTAEYWCSSYDTLIDFSLLLDVSHVNIWHRGDEKKTKETCMKLLDLFSVGAIHLSHNQGKSDTHDLIPRHIWFDDYLQEWSEKYLVTYESLPIDYAAYERLDKCRKFKVDL